MQPHRGPVILVLGILGFLVCQIFAPIAWIMGKTDLKEMDAGRMDPTGKGLTQAGMILGIIGTILIALSIVLVIVWFIFIALAVGLQN
jgi:hypothetical protein